MQDFITIQEFMRKDLGLSGNELIVYAVIYGFSKDKESKFYGSRQYLADWCGCSVRQIQTILNNLTDKKLVIKEENYINGIKQCRYVANFTTSEKTSPPSEIISPPSEKTSPNNINNNIYNTKVLNNNILSNNTKVLSYNSDSATESNSSNSLIDVKSTSVKKKKLTPRDVITGYTDNEQLRKTLWEFNSDMQQKYKGEVVKWNTNKLRASLNKLDLYAKTDEEKIEMLVNTINSKYKNIYNPNKTLANTYNPITRQNVFGEQPEIVSDKISEDRNNGKISF